MTTPAAPDPVVARVIPDLTGLDRQFDYLVPPALVAQVGIGTQVRVSLAGRRIGGWVASIGGPDPKMGVERLLPIIKVTGYGPSQPLFDLAAWAVPRWAGRLRAFLVAASPHTAVAALPAASFGPPVPQPVNAGAAQLLAVGGGLMRVPPCTDVLTAVLSACCLGPVVLVAPSLVEARLLAARLRRSGRTVALLPSDWAAAAAGVDVVVGARTAIWGPCPNIAAVVVVDEHDESLQEQRQPTWHAREVAIERARQAGVPCLLISPVPSIAAIYWAGPRLVRPATIDEREGWPMVEIVDRSRDEPWQRSMVTSALIRQLRDPERIVVCVLNTTGRARLLACRSCKSLQRCELCEAAVIQNDDSRFVCLRCTTVRPAVCQECGGSAFANLRKGVTRLREELQAAAGRPVVAVTAANNESDLVAEAGVYIGTEAVLHRVRRADTVCFLDFDDELLAPRYRAAEQAMTLLSRAARVVGGRTVGGRLLIQTFLPKHEVIDAVRHSDPGRLVTKELARRTALGFPPVAALAVLSGGGAHELAALLPGDQVQTARTLDGRVMLRSSSWDLLGAALSTTPRPKGARIRIEIDPPRV